MKKLLFVFCLLLFNSFFAQQKMKDYRDILKSKNIYEINAFLRDAHPDDPRRSVLKPKVMQLIKDYLREAKPGDQRIKELQEMLALLRMRSSTKISFEEMNEIIRRKQVAVLQEQLRTGKIKLADVENSTILNSSTSPQYNYGASTVSNDTSAEASSGSAVSNSNIAALEAEKKIMDAEAEEFKMLMNISEADLKNKTTQVLNSLFDNDPMSKECIVLIQNKSDCNIIVRIEGAGFTKYRLAVPAKKENSIVVQKGDYLFTSLVCGAQYASQKTIQKALMVALGNPAPLPSKK